MAERTLLERKVKALEEYLGIVFEPDDDTENPYDSYHEKDYSDMRRIKEKVFGKKKKKYSWD